MPRNLGVPGGESPGQTGGITRVVYESIRGATQLVGQGMDTLAARLQLLLESTGEASPETPQREAVLGALNDVMGNRLVASHNLLATVMALRFRGEVLNWQALPPAADVTSEVLLLIQGLGMTDLQWHTQSTRRNGDKSRVIGPGRSPGLSVGLHPGLSALQLRAVHLAKRARTLHLAGATRQLLAHAHQ